MKKDRTENREREIAKILTSLGFSEKAGNSHSHVLITIPTWRNRDIAIPEDRWKRLSGLDTVQPSMPKVEMRAPVRMMKKIGKKNQNI